MTMIISVMLAKIMVEVAIKIVPFTMARNFVFFSFSILVHWTFGSNAAASHQKQLLEELRLSRQVAVRKGQLRFRAWESHAHGFRPIFQQKGVDMKIGLDVAWIATKKIADIIVLVTADTDFIAPMKLARKEGVTVCLCSLDRGTVSSDLREHADICLTIATES